MGGPRSDGHVDPRPRAPSGDGWPRRRERRRFAHVFVMVVGGDLEGTLSPVCSSPARSAPGSPNAFLARGCSSTNIRCFRRSGGPLIGPVVAIRQLSCARLATSHWPSFCGSGRKSASAGVVSFIFCRPADSCRSSIFYRKYYGMKMTLVITGVFYLAMGRCGVCRRTALCLNRGLIPDRADTQMPDEGITWNYTPLGLNLAFPSTRGVARVALRSNWRRRDVENDGRNPRPRAAPRASRRPSTERPHTTPAISPQQSHGDDQH